jgi:hypothetical protein
LIFQGQTYNLKKVPSAQGDAPLPTVQSLWEHSGNAERVWCQ